MKKTFNILTNIINLHFYVVSNTKQNYLYQERRQPLIIISPTHLIYATNLRLRKTYFRRTKIFASHSPQNQHLLAFITCSCVTNVYQSLNIIDPPLISLSHHQKGTKYFLRHISAEPIYIIKISLVNVDQLTKTLTKSIIF